MYVPVINDRVRYKNMEGWVYCITDQYFTLEISTKPMTEPSSIHSPHRSHHCLLCVFTSFYDQVEYLGRRESIYHDTIINDTNKN